MECRFRFTTTSKPARTTKNAVGAMSTSLSDWHFNNLQDPWRRRAIFHAATALFCCCASPAATEGMRPAPGKTESGPLQRGNLSRPPPVKPSPACLSAALLLVVEDVGLERPHCVPPVVMVRLKHVTANYAHNFNWRSKLLKINQNGPGIAAVRRHGAPPNCVARVA